MIPHKFKIDKTVQKKVTTLKGYEGNCVKLQAVLYSSDNPSSHLYIYDKDGDLVSFPIPGQGTGEQLVELYSVDCKLPLRILDETGNNSVIIYGTVYRPAL